MHALGRWRLLAAVAISTVGLMSMPGIGAAAVQGTAGVRPLVIVPAPATSLNDAAAERVAQMSVSEQATSIVMGHISSQDPAVLRAYMAGGLGGFILMGANIPATEASLQEITSALAAETDLPPLIAVDQEGGIVSRLNSDDFAASRTLKDRPTADTAAAFSGRGALVARAGITVNFGTVADFTSDSSSFIFGRALGRDVASAAERVVAATTSQEQFVASTLKHFPGHGAAAGDSHHSIPTTGMSYEQWETTEAVPFVEGIDAGASLLMFGHLTYSAVDQTPASLSARWHEIAREDLGFDGVIVTDDLGMLLSSGVPAYADPVSNAVAAVAAGNDLVLMIAGSTAQTAGQLAAGIAAAVESGALPAQRLEDAARRVTALRLKIAATSSDWAACSDCAPAG